MLPLLKYLLRTGQICSLQPGLVISNDFLNSESFVNFGRHNYCTRLTVNGKTWLHFNKNKRCYFLKQIMNEIYKINEAFNFSVINLKYGSKSVLNDWKTYACSTEGSIFNESNSDTEFGSPSGRGDTPGAPTKNQVLKMFCQPYRRHGSSW